LEEAPCAKVANIPEKAPLCKHYLANLTVGGDTSLTPPFHVFYDFMIRGMYKGSVELILPAQ
jgi:hypothetical protein